VPHREGKQNSFLAEAKHRNVRGCSFRLAVIALAVCGLLTASCDRGDHPGNIGSPAPQFTINDGAQALDLSSLRGHVVVLNFWATWCVPCIEEVPSLVRLQQRLPQVTVVAISSDEDPAAYRQFLMSNNVDFLTLRDPSQRIPHLYGTIKIPESYVIDRKGILRRKFVSAQNWTDPEIVSYLSKL
jgi:cytochrome c biogenesis protein CcmG/thiol:disulfide interchange protein DsbE